MGLFGDLSKSRAPLDAAVRASARPATRLCVGRPVRTGHVFAPTEMHLGGEPYAEAGERWPTWGNRSIPYDFVGQLDLRSCPERPDVPVDLLTIFLCWSAIEEVSVEDACIVRGYRGADSSKAVPLRRLPAVGAEDYRVVPCPISVEPAITYPWSPDDDPAIRRAAAAFKHPEREYRDARRRAGEIDPYFSHVGGFPTWVHEATLAGDGLAFVAQIAHEPHADLVIQDAAPIYIAWSRTESRFHTDPFQSF